MKTRCKPRTRRIIKGPEVTPASWYQIKARDRAEGLLSDQEMASLLAAYGRGSRGDVLIGTLLVTRLLVLHLPASPNEAEAVRRMEQAARTLRRVGCDGWGHIRLVRLRLNAGTAACPLAMVVDQLVGGGTDRLPCQHVQRLDGRGRWLLNGDERLEDGVSLVLRRIFSVQKSDTA